MRIIKLSLIAFILAFSAATLANGDHHPLVEYSPPPMSMQQTKPVGFYFGLGGGISSVLAKYNDIFAL